jgi:hypothetical protein
MRRTTRVKQSSRVANRVANTTKTTQVAAVAVVGAVVVAVEGVDADAGAGVAA